jgi:hypothetical protein
VAFLLVQNLWPPTAQSITVYPPMDLLLVAATAAAPYQLTQQQQQQGITGVVSTIIQAVTVPCAVRTLALSRATCTCNKEARSTLTLRRYSCSPSAGACQRHLTVGQGGQQEEPGRGCILARYQCLWITRRDACSMTGLVTSVVRIRSGPDSSSSRDGRMMMCRTNGSARQEQQQQQQQQKESHASDRLAHESPSSSSSRTPGYTRGRSCRPGSTTKQQVAITKVCSSSSHSSGGSDLTACTAVQAV